MREIIKKLSIFTCFLLFGISMYFIIINVKHQNYISDKYTVKDSDIYLKDYKKNVNAILDNLNAFKETKGNYIDDYEKIISLNQKVNSCYFHLINEKTIYDLNKDSELSYVDIYNYTNYVYNSLINDCWVTNLSKVKNNNYLSTYFKRLSLFQEEIDMILYNTKNLKNRLLANSLYTYGSNDSKYMIYNPLNESYNEMTKIYDDVSKIVLDFSNYLVKGEDYEEFN